ncbi:MAG: lysophospholipid acyltransferase family protein, partial [Planctomycetes bacterium]|nr:lysophospholipid acyltransferase family protein [Planctomycetota bacterium]
VLSLLPFGLAGWCGRRLGDLFRLVDRRHRQRVEEQAAARLGLAPEAVPPFTRRNFQHYGQVLAEFARLRRLGPRDIANGVDMDGFKEFVHDLLREGNGVIFVTSHFGNWEWMNSLATSLELTGGSFARPLDNPRLNRYVNYLRERNGLKILEKRRSLRTALHILADNGVVGILVDQDAGWQGLMSPFLGRPASTITLPVELARRTASPMVVVGLRRGGTRGRRFTLVYNRRVHRTDPNADPAAEIRRVTDALNQDLGEMIFAAPDQWFWIHRRWKSEGKKLDGGQLIR